MPNFDVDFSREELHQIIQTTVQYIMWDINDHVTRAHVRNTVVGFLCNWRERRQICDFRVICDESNNTPAIIDQNQFVIRVEVQPIDFDDVINFQCIFPPPDMNTTHNPIDTIMELEW